jgi:hypothetical protein
MSDLPTKNPTLEELREKLDHHELKLKKQKRCQSNLYDDWSGTPNRDKLDQKLKESIARSNAKITALKKAIYEIEHPTLPKPPSFYQRLKTKLSSKKRGRSQSCSQ